MSKQSINDVMKVRPGSEGKFEPLGYGSYEEIEEIERGGYRILPDKVVGWGDHDTLIESKGRYFLADIRTCNCD